MLLRLLYSLRILFKDVTCLKLTTAVGMKNLQSLKNEDVFKTVLKLDLLLANKKKRYLISGFF